MELCLKLFVALLITVYCTHTKLPYLASKSSTASVPLSRKENRNTAGAQLYPLTNDHVFKSLLNSKRYYTEAFAGCIPYVQLHQTTLLFLAKELTFIALVMLAALNFRITFPAPASQKVVRQPKAVIHP